MGKEHISNRRHSDDIVLGAIELKGRESSHLFALPLADRPNCKLSGSACKCTSDVFVASEIVKKFIILVGGKSTVRSRVERVQAEVKLCSGGHHPSEMASERSELCIEWV